MAAPSGTNITTLKYDGNIIEMNTSLSYHCMDGKKFQSNFTQATVEATCILGMDWTEPADWGTCVDRERHLWHLTKCILDAIFILQTNCAPLPRLRLQTEW
jgi:hypothetical protein